MTHDHKARAESLGEGIKAFYDNQGRFITSSDSDFATEALNEAYEAGQLTRGKYKQFFGMMKRVYAARDSLLSAMERDHETHTSLQQLENQRETLEFHRKKYDLLARIGSREA